MGIKYLNRYLTNHCSANSISKKSLSDFRNRVLVIDTSIYLYRFAETNMLVEGFYNLVSIFKKYHITPIFVFDGKPPAEKKELLEKRRAEKNTAEKIYNELKTQLADTGLGETGDKKQELINEMETLKKKFVRIKPADIQTVKRLLSAYGTLCIDSLGEADQLCAYMVRNNYAWACVSDDMDMFLYGCTRSIRHISLMHQTGILYNTPEIVKELQMTQEIFTDIAILSGTDYNIHQKVNLYEIMKQYATYIAITLDNVRVRGITSEAVVEDLSSQVIAKTPNEPQNQTFHQWIREQPQYSSMCIETLDKIRRMFQLDGFTRDNSSYLKELCENITKPIEIDKSRLHDMLKKDGFIFV